MSLPVALEAALIEAARLARSALYRACGPFERLLGNRREPPLWLRRHAGPVANFSSSARETRDLIARLSLVRKGSRILDAGCGAGAMALELGDLLGPEGTYVGFDVHEPSIRWCRNRFAGDRRLNFELARIRTPYSRRSSGSAREFRFPAADGSCDFVLAKSLFTHLLTPEAESYLREIARVLAPDGRALVTTFLFDPAAATPAFPFGEPSGSLRWRLRARPHAAVAYSRPVFESMIRAAGLRAERRIDGFYPGTAPIPSGQDTFILSRGG